MNHTVALKFAPVNAQTEDCIAVLALDRADAANAFNDAMLHELRSAFEQVARHARCRALILRGKGKHFCAGADLNWMKDSAKLSFEQNVTDAKKLTSMFEALANIPFPTIAAVHGAAFGGAVGLAAACDIVVARADAKFCLSEVKVGLLPAVIVPYVAKRLTRGAMRRFGLSGQVITASTAYDIGLADRIAQDDQEFIFAVREELSALLSASPAAQVQLKKLLTHLESNHLAQSDATAESIAKVRTSSEGQAGLQAFFDKVQAPWVLKLDDKWNWD